MLRTLSSRSTHGNAIHTVECNTEAATKLVPEDVQKAMRDAVTLLGKKAAIWVCDYSKDPGELDVRFAVLHKNAAIDEPWNFHRLVCVPRYPEPNSDEWCMVKSYYEALYQEAEWAGISKEDFAAYLSQEGLLG